MTTSYKLPEKDPLVYCVMPTRARRRWCIERSIKCFLAQSYERSLLCILDDPDQGVRDIAQEWMARSNRIVYEVSHAKTLGEKYNDGCRSAPPEALIALWGDDDWQHPERLAWTVEAMEGSDTDIGGSMSMLVHRVADAATVLYAHPFAGPAVNLGEGQFLSAFPNMIGGTMVFARRRWVDHPFAPLPTGSDSVFAMNLLSAGGYLSGRPFDMTIAAGDNCQAVISQHDGGEQVRFIQLNDPRMYVAMVHGDNTGNPLMGSGTAHAQVVPGDARERITTWESLGEPGDPKILEMLAQLMGESAPLFLGVRGGV